MPRQVQRREPRAIKTTDENQGRVPQRTFVQDAGWWAGGMVLGAGAASRAAEAATASAERKPLPRRVLGRTKVPVGILSLGTGTVGLSPAVSTRQIAEIVNIGPHDARQLRQNVEWAMADRPLSREEKATLAEVGRRLAAEWGDHFGPVSEDRDPPTPA